MSNVDLTRSMVGKVVGSSGRTTSLLPALLIVAVLVLTVSVICVKVLFSRRKVGKMMREMRLADEEKIQALEDEVMAECGEERAAAQEVAEAAEDKVTRLKDQIRERRAKHAALMSELRAVTNWDDLDVIDARE